MRKYRWEKTPDIYVRNGEAERFSLGLSGSPMLICFGINPSTADVDYADKTAHMVEQISKNNGYNGWLILNVYPLRSTNLDNLPSTVDLELHYRNLCYIEKLLENRDSALWAAWGNSITKRPYLFDCLCDIHAITSKSNCQWLAFGKEENGLINSTTISSHPRHPSRLPLTVKPNTFDMEHYLAMLKEPPEFKTKPHCSEFVIS